MVERFHAEPRVQATELLLQERVPRDVGADRAAPARRDARRPRRSRRCRCGATARRTRCSRTRSSSRTATTSTSMTNAGGGDSVWRGLPVTRWRRDATRDGDGQFIYLRDVRSGAVWSATYQPSRREPDEYAVTFSADRASVPSARRGHLDAARHRGLDRRRRRGAAPHRPQPRLAHPRARRDQLRRDRPHVRRQRPRPSRRSASSSSKPSTCRTAPPCCAIGGRGIPGDAAAWAFHALSLEGRPQGPVEWETDRARFLGRGRNPADPAGARRPRALGHDRRRARSDRQPSSADPPSGRAPPSGSAFATGMASDRETVEALARKYHDPERHRAHVRAGR